MSARHTFDRAGSFKASRRAEHQYGLQLRKIARHIGTLVRGFDTTTLPGVRYLQDALRRYGEILTPWAEATVARVLAEVAQRDAQAWAGLSSKMGTALRQEIATAPTGLMLREAQAAQVGLITSLPIEAGIRVHKLVLEGIVQGTRADVTAREIGRTGEVTAARATLIARTETSRVSTLLTQARAQHIGCETFVWRTASDSDVRPSHKKLNGQTFRWDTPPLCDAPDHHALPGCIWNCRCYAEPVIPEA